MKRSTWIGVLLSVAMASGCGEPAGGGMPPDSNLLVANDLSVGGQTACAVLENDAVACWGWNGTGILDASTTDASTPTLAWPDDLRDVRKVVVGGRHACAVTHAGEALCWGRNDDGQSGTGSASDEIAEPSSVGGADALDVALGTSHTCVLRNTGDVECFGDSYSGQAGVSSSDPVLEPTGMGFDNAEAVAAGDTHTCAILSGFVHCWGGNSDGQLGRGTSGFGAHPEPRSVGGISDAAAIVASSSFTCALHADGRVSCWGGGPNGELGAGTGITASAAPVEVEGLDDAVALGAGSVHACAVRASGAVVCWGFNRYGQLGDGTTQSSSVPVEVVGISDAVSVGAGAGYTCVHHATGAVSCWGANSDGRLGNGTEEDSLAPVSVLALQSP